MGRPLGINARNAWVEEAQVLRNVVLRNVRGPLDHVEQRLHRTPQRMTVVIRTREP